MRGWGQQSRRGDHRDQTKRGHSHRHCHRRLAAAAACACRVPPLESQGTGIELTTWMPSPSLSGTCYYMLCRVIGDGLICCSVHYCGSVKLHLSCSS